MSRPWVKVVTLPIAVLAVYFVVPVDAERAPVGFLTGVVLSIAALGAVVVLVYTEVRSAQRRLTGWHLVLALEITLVVFSFIYYVLTSNDPAQFAGLETRLDAIYFSTATAATVGYGDVHPTGQLSRGLVTVQMVFNIVFVAAVVNLAKERMTERRNAVRRSDHGPDESA